MPAQYDAMVTATGRAKIASAQSGGPPLALSHLVVGDANGEGYEPTDSQSELRHEVWRGALTELTTDIDNPDWIIARSVIPPAAGGFWVREVGLLDSSGALIVVARYADSYKPLLADGTAKELDIGLVMAISNASNVVLQIDPSVVFATRQFVESQLAAIGNVGDINYVETFELELGTPGSDGAGETVGPDIDFVATFNSVMGSTSGDTSNDGAISYSHRHTPDQIDDLSTDPALTFENALQ